MESAQKRKKTRLEKERKAGLEKLSKKWIESRMKKYRTTVNMDIMEQEYK